MNSNQRSEANNQSNNGGNELETNSAQAGTAGHTGAAAAASLQAARQGGTVTETGSQPSGAHQPGYQNAAGSEQSTDHAGSQTASNPAPELAHEGNADLRQSNDLAGGLPKSPGGNRQWSDEKMNDDTGLSNTANREAPAVDAGNRQGEQSNVGRRSDGTPD